jgi:hypothetical protein
MARNSIGARLVFENARQFIASQGYNVGQAVLTQSYIRSEQVLNVAANSYTFPLTVTALAGNTNFSTMLVGQLQDVHVVSEIGFFWALPAAAPAVGSYAFPLYSYPNREIFPLGFAAMYSFYNGNISMKVNNQNVVVAIDTFRNYVVNQTQQGATVPPIDQLDGAEDGFFANEPNLLINGAANIVLQVNLPGAISTIDAGARLVLIMRTILAQNVTSVK